MSRKPVLFSYLAAVAALCALLAAGPAFAGTLADIKARGVITFGTDAFYQPFEYVDVSGQLVGFDIDLGNEIARRMGLKAKFLDLGWDELPEALSGKKIDAILSAVTITPKRQEVFTFSLPYRASGQVVVIAKGTRHIKGKHGLKGKVVGVQMRTTSESEARNIPGVKAVRTYPTFSEAFLELAFKRLDAVIVDSDVAAYFSSRYPKRFRVVGEPFMEGSLGVAFRKGDTDLRDAVDAALKAAAGDGSIAAIAKKHGM